MQIIIKTDDPLSGVRTETFTSRVDAGAYMDQIWPVIVTAPAEEPQAEIVDEPMVSKNPVEKPAHKPAATVAVKRGAERAWFLSAAGCRRSNMGRIV